MLTFNNIADYFISLSNETQSLITNLKLQKLVYYAQAWHLAIKGEELFEDEFEAWIHGPVIPELYVQYKDFGWKPIIRDDLSEGSFERISSTFGKELSDFMSELCDEYFGSSAYELELLTHKEEPWKVARIGLPEDAPSHNIISKESMTKYYSQFVQ